MGIVLLLSLMLAQAGASPQAAPAQPTPARPTQPRVQTPRRAAAANVAGLAITVTDGSGVTMPGVTVDVTGPTPKNGQTDPAGQISFPGLQPGTYRLRFSGDAVTAFEREVTLRSGQIEKLAISLTPAAPVRAATPVAPPTPVPAPAVGPKGEPQVIPLVDLVERELISGSQPRKDTLVACTGNTRSMLVQLNQPQADRVYDEAEALYYVVAGEGSMKVAGREVVLKAGSYASLPRGAVHALTRSGRRPLILLAVLSGEPCETAK
jgi:mannose-6-phosphate isomerase-like protein (cupin superfamily)